MKNEKEREYSWYGFTQTLSFFFRIAIIVVIYDYFIRAVSHWSHWHLIGLKAFLVLAGFCFLVEQMWEIGYRI